MSNRPVINEATSPQGDRRQSERLPSPSAPPSVDTASLHGELHACFSSDRDRESSLARFGEIIHRHTSAVGVGLIEKDADGEWSLSNDRTTGNLPTREDFIKKFASACDTTVQRKTIQIEHFLGLQAIYAPVPATVGKTDVMLVLVDSAHASSALYAMEIASAYLSQFLSSANSRRNDWKLTSLAAMIELVSEIESQETVDGACSVVANELVRHVGAHHVAVGLLRRGQIEVRSLSGAVELDRVSDDYRNLEIALNECLARDTIGIYPNLRPDESHLLLAHRQLCSAMRVEGVVSCPLRTPTDKVVGAILLTGPTELIHGDRLPNFVRASAPRIASALDVASRAERTGLRKLVHSIRTHTKSWRGVTWFMLAMVVISIMLVPVQYKVRCNCETEPVGRRFAVSPFAGIIEEGFVQAGDQVVQGQLLARMDAQEIRWELAGVLAEQQQAAKQREIELAGRNVTESMLSDMERERLAAKADLLRHRLESVEIRSPIDGVVLTGSLERAQGAAISMGDVIYEVAPPNHLRLEVMVPSDEVPHVEVGQPIQIWIDGISDASFRSIVSRIRPSSELHEGKNVFVAEVLLPTSDSRLRPGMHGSVRINCASNPLFWNLFHRPWDWFVSRMTWW